MTPRAQVPEDAGTMLSCLAIPTFVRTIGDGPPVIVLHGGPGFSHDYLVAPLRGLAQRRRLIFFDQPGCGRSGDPDQALTAELVARHFRALLGQVLGADQRFGILAHSWGAVVLWGADVAMDDGPSLAEGLLVTPVPTTRPAWDAAVSTLLARIPPAVAATFLDRLGTAQDADFDPLLPFYRAPGASAPAGEIRVRGQAYMSVLTYLGQYDLRAQARRAAPRLDVVLGRLDFTEPELLADVLAAARRTTTLETGHFPFWEDPVGFEAALRMAFP